MSGGDVLDLILKSQEKLEIEIRQIREALVRLARIEERHTAHTETLTRFGKWLDNHERRIGKLDRSVATNTKSTGLFDRLIERALMVLIGAGIAAVVIFK